MGVQTLVADLGPAASDAGVALLPASAFFSTLSDLLASLTAHGLERVDDIDVAYWIDAWRPSGLAYSNFLELMGQPLLEHRHGLVEVAHMPPTRIVDFLPPIGQRRVVMWPGPELCTIPRHIDVNRLRTSMTTSTLAPRPLERLVPQVSRILSTGLRHTATARLTERTFAWTSGGGHEPILDDPTRFAIVMHLRSTHVSRIAALSGTGIY